MIDCLLTLTVGQHTVDLDGVHSWKNHQVEQYLVSCTINTITEDELEQAFKTLKLGLFNNERFLKFHKIQVIRSTKKA